MWFQQDLIRGNDLSLLKGMGFRDQNDYFYL